MDGTAVKEVERITREAVKPEIIKVNGVEYSTKALHDLREAEKSAKTLTVATLAALVGYLEANVDTLDREKLIVHVAGPTRVDLLSRLTEDGFFTRQTFLSAQCHDRLSGFSFGNWYALEDLNIALLSRFEDTGDRAELIKLLGNIKSEDIVTLSDDGASQSVAVRSGLAVQLGDDRVRVKNPWYLAPFRTFAEVSQPESPFVVRVKLENGRGPQAAGVYATLIEADGGEWRNTAIEKVATFLRNSDIDVPVIA